MTNLDDPKMKAFKERMDATDIDVYNGILDDPRLTEDQIKYIMDDDYPNFCEYRRKVKKANQ